MLTALRRLSNEVGNWSKSRVCSNYIVKNLECLTERPDYTQHDSIVDSLVRKTAAVTAAAAPPPFQLGRHVCNEFN